MNVDAGLYGDYEIAGKMLEEHERKDQQVSVEVFEAKFVFFLVFKKRNCNEASNNLALLCIFVDGPTKHCKTSSA